MSTTQKGTQVAERTLIGATTKQDMTTQFIEITPDIAREWLDSMAPNRKISRTNLDNLIKAMESGRWHMDGSPIKFNRGGQLIDGQHRLQAIIETGMPQKFLVVWGVDETAMTTLDTGKSRSRGDVLLIHDPTITDVNNVAAATTMMLRWHLGARNNNLRNEYVSNDQVVQFYDQHKDEIRAAARHGKKLNVAMGAGSQQAFGLCYWLFSEIEADDAEFFWDRLTDGQGLELGNPIYALRELLRREAVSASTRDKMRADVVIALTIKAWNAYRDGESIQLLRFKVGGAHPEKFPEPK
jgi:hypothetical protein